MNMQIISRQERTEVRLSDKCLPNLNAKKMSEFTQCLVSPGKFTVDIVSCFTP